MERGNNIENTKNVKEINEKMIGVYLGKFYCNSASGECKELPILEPIIPYKDFEQNRLNGIKIGKKIFFKNWDTTECLEIDTPNIQSIRDNRTLKSLKEADIITFQLQADVKKYELTNIDISNIQKYLGKDSNEDSIKRIKKLTFGVEMKYSFCDKPSNFNDIKRVINQMTDKISPESIALYLICACNHKSKVINYNDITLYTKFWTEENLLKAIDELCKAGYLVKDSLYNRIDYDSLPDYLISDSKNDEDLFSDNDIDAKLMENINTIVKSYMKKYCYKHCDLLQERVL